MGMLKSQIGKPVRGSERQHLSPPATRWKQKAFRIPLYVLLPSTEGRGEVATCPPGMTLDDFIRFGHSSFEPYCCSNLMLLGGHPCARAKTTRPMLYCEDISYLHSFGLRPLHLLTPEIELWHHIDIRGAPSHLQHPHAMYGQHTKDG